MRKFLALILLLAFATTVNAFDIILISDAEAPGVNPAGNHEDDTLVDFLTTTLGYTVDTSGMGMAYQDGQNPFDDPAKVAALNSAGMVLVSRRTNSGAYDGNIQAWNGLANPLLLNSGYLTRDSRWGWADAGSSDVLNKTETDVDYGPGVSELIPNTMFDWTGSPAGQAPKGPFLPNAGATLAGDVVGTFDGQAFLVDIPAGTDLDAALGLTGKGVTGDRRAFLGTWGYDDGPTGTNGPGGTPAQWGDYMTIQYKALMAETIKELIPEPMTVVLLGLGAFGALRRRR
jgi:hypothetical protein